LWTQAELAEKAGLSVSLVQRLEKKDASTITAKNARRLADAMGIPVDDLLARASPHAGLMPIRGPLRVLALQLLGTDDPELLEVASLLALATLPSADCRQLVSRLQSTPADELPDLLAEVIKTRSVSPARAAIGTRRAATRVIPPENESQFLEKHGPKGKGARQ
jgi:transcriptional regulator with XRE-family HTH domain